MSMRVRIRIWVMRYLSCEGRRAGAPLAKEREGRHPRRPDAFGNGAERERAVRTTPAALIKIWFARSSMWRASSTLATRKICGGGEESHYR